MQVLLSEVIHHGIKKRYAKLKQNILIRNFIIFIKYNKILKYQNQLILFYIYFYNYNSLLTLQQKDFFIGEFYDKIPEYIKKANKS